MFWAHTGTKWQVLRDHLIQVGTLAEELALAAGASREFALRAKACGLLHDLGKYTADFQKLLRGEVKRAPHSIYGAAAAAQIRAIDVSFAIAGHHAGMPDKVVLADRTQAAKAVLGEIWATAIADCPELAAALELPPLTMKDPLEFDVGCRMLLS
jgi:CRISPR-associated endonuclease/helicase Cas3